MSSPRVDRRRFLLGAAVAATLAACRSAARAGRALGTTTTLGARTGPSTQHGPAGSTPQGPAAFVDRGAPSSKAVALTFHGSGDPKLTAAMLEVTRRLGFPITVFAVGNWLEQYPSISRDILAAGHELANHTYTHPALGTVSRDRVAKEITGCRDVLAAQTGSGGTWFRPSGIERPTAMMLEEAGRAGYGTVVGFSVDPLDYQDPGADAVASRVTAGLHPGAIVSLHLGHSGTVEAMQRIARAIRARGLELVTVTRLLGAR